MTVCVGLLCNSGYGVLGASDQMVSTADNQTKRLKIYHVTERVVMLMAGDVATHTELMIELRTLIDANSENPQVLTVKNLADAYASAFAAAKHRQGVRQYLSPLGITSDELKTGKVSEKLAESLAKEMLYHQMPSCSAIFMGVDESGGYSKAHLYQVDNDRLTCCDGAGYACIGVGFYQAASSLMFSGFKQDNQLDQALFQIFAAKKRAEVAPGVGRETDMVYISSADSKYIMLSDQIVDELDKIYARAEAGHSRTNIKAERQCHEFLENLRKKPVEQPQKIELSGAPPQEGGAEPSPTIAGTEPAPTAGV